MRISDWSSDVCSSDLEGRSQSRLLQRHQRKEHESQDGNAHKGACGSRENRCRSLSCRRGYSTCPCKPSVQPSRSEEHTSELQSLMRISYAVFCLTKKNKTNTRSHI